MSRLVRKSSEAGRAEVRSISGFGSGAACFFRLKALEEKEGRGGTSFSSEGRRLPSGVLSPTLFFLERKRFIVSAALVALLDYTEPVVKSDRVLEEGYDDV